MARYERHDQIEPGTKVLVSKPGPYGGKIGEVVPSEGRQVWSTTHHNTRMTWVKVPGRESPFGFFSNNLERIEEMTYVKNLVGPKPEPVQEPKHPTPWTFKGRDVLDANGKVIFRIQVRGMYNDDVPMPDAYELTSIVAKSVNEKYGKKAEDSPSPF